MPRRRPTSPVLRLTSLLLAGALVAPSAGLISAARAETTKRAAPTTTTTAATTGKPATSAPRAAAKAAARRAARAADRREGQLLVGFRLGTSEQERDALAKSSGAERRRLRGGSDVELWTLGLAKSADAALATLSLHHAVEYAEPNYTVAADQFVPDDSRFAEQWALGGSGQADATPGAGIDAARAWSKGTGSRSTVIAVIDAGIDFTHPDLAANVWANPADPANGRDDDGNGLIDDAHGWDWVEGSSEMKDPAGHGTAVAGLVAAEGGNGLGVTGVMWRASLMSLRVLDASGAGDVASAVEAMDYASSHGAHVINCSFGTDGESRALRESVERAGIRGSIVVASAGNDGRNVDARPRYPASYELPHVLSVTSSDRFAQLTPSANWGARNSHVAAPGAGLLTTAPGGGYREVDGTSASAALAAGVAGLVKTMRPGLDPRLVREAITQGAARVGGLEGKVSSGGLLSAAGALARLDALPGGKGDDGRGGGGKKGEGEGKDDRKKKDAAGGTPAAGGAKAAGLGGGITQGPRPEGVRGRPAPRLPDLETARRHVPVRPRAPAPVPSTLRNCPPHNPRCNGGAAPTPTHAAQAAGPSDQIHLARAGYDVPRLGVKTDLTLLDFMREAAGLSDSDAGTPRLELPRLFAVSHALLPALFGAAAQTGHNAEFVSMSVPAAMSAGETYNVSVTMRNTGVTTWRPEESYRLGEQGSTGTTWRLGRVQLPSVVRPVTEVGTEAATVTIPFTVTAPTVASPPGGYSFRWRMVQDNLEWFGQPTDDRMIAVTAPNYEGEFEAAGCSGITGWAWDSRRPNAPVEVDVFEQVAPGNEIFLARVVADQYRPTLGRGDNRHGFSLAPPAAVRDGGGPHTIVVRFANTAFQSPGHAPLTHAADTPDPKTVTGCAAPPNATGPPPSLVVTSASDTRIDLAWTPAVGASRYRVERALTKSGPFVFAGYATGASFPDTGRTRAAAYLYRVCAADSYDNCVSPYGNVALATAFTFTDPTLYAGSTAPKKEHVNELRQTVGAVRVAAELGAASWGPPVASGNTIHASHIRDLRANLTEALSALNILPPAYTDPTIAAGANGTPIRKAHVEELRLRSTRVSGTVSNQSGQSGTLASAARLEARNRTGGGGVDLLSGNFNWGLPLLALRGRAGLDLGLGLSYNSLVWTKSGSTLYFNADEGSPAPGFRLGFPVVQPQYYNPQTGTNAYLLVTPSGGRVELRQVAAGEYESADSSYLKLYAFAADLLHLWTPDGTRTTFHRHGSSHYVAEIRDANGNRISANHDSAGRLTSVTDTLSRTVTFNYDANQNLLSITQPWGGQTHTWATFGYGVATIGADAFSGAVTTYGAQEGQAVNVLTQVGLADGSSYRFEYNDYAQVRKVSRHSADDHRLAYAAYDYEPVTDDCPRVSSRKDWALDWNDELEATTTYNRDAGGAWGEATSPNGTRLRELFDTGQVSGWRKGLTTGTEIFAGGIRQKWTALEWTQDDPTLSYRKNPRTTGSHVYDRENNHRRTKVVYYTPAELSPAPPGPALTSAFGLAKDIFEYGADAATVLRRTRLEYNLGSAYLNSRVIGLVSGKYVYEGGDDVNGGGVLRSKVTSAYDETDGGRLAPTSTTATPTHHDVLYGTGYSAGRGNLTSIRRWSVSGPFTADNPQYVESKIGYNTTGSVIFSTDPAGHRTEVAYGDSFVDQAEAARTLAFQTFAYPTTVKDPDLFTTTAKYDYDLGAVRQAQTPQPNTTTNTPGPVQTTRYDAAGRVERRFNSVNGESAATRFVYAPGQNWVQTFSKLQAGAADAYAIQVMDGAGRVYASASSYPGGAGGYRGQHVVHDAMGRAVRSSNPTAMTSAWEPADEDAADGIPAAWYYAQQDYDWMSRPTYSTNPDGSMNQEVVYGGCGCAGGAAVTVRDAAGRRQKSFSDALGRVTKTQALNFDGTVYSMRVSKYDALDRATEVWDIKGDTEPATCTDASVCQLSKMEYDGHGRLSASHVPEQRDANNQITWMSYTYYGDDQVKKVTDPRGASTEISYNNRHLVSLRDHTEVSGVAAAPDVSYEYDAAGNRTKMTDGLGSVGYEYDQLSRTLGEERRFTDLVSLPNTNQGKYKLTYQYALSGALEKITDPAGLSVNYQHDAAGQLIGVTGTGYTYTDWSNTQQRVELPVPTFASGIKYRAWGAVKELTYGNGVRHQSGFDVDLLVTNSTLSLPGGGAGMAWNYSYYDDGSVKTASDVENNKFDRKYEYDHLGRLKEAYSGLEARGGTYQPGTTPPPPYRQSYSYDAFGHLTAETGRVWQNNLLSNAYSFTNNRRPFVTYDAAGNVLTDERGGGRTLDVAGRLSKLTSGYTVGGGPCLLQQPGAEDTFSYDGDGALAKSVSLSRKEEPTGTQTCPDMVITESSSTTYRVRSAVLGGAVVAQLDGAGQKTVGYVRAGGRLLARHDITPYYDTVQWEHPNEVTGSWVEMGPEGSLQRREMDALGMEVGVSAPPAPPSYEPVMPRENLSFIPIEGQWTGEAEIGLAQHLARINSGPNSLTLSTGPSPTFGDVLRVLEEGLAWAADRQASAQRLEANLRLQQMDGAFGGGGYSSSASADLLGGSLSSDFFEVVWGADTYSYGEVSGGNLNVSVTAHSSMQPRRRRRQEGGPITTTPLTLGTRITPKELTPLPPYTADVLKHSIFSNEQLLARINDCITGILGEEKAGLLRGIMGELSWENSPAIDVRLTSEGIGQQHNVGLRVGGKFQPSSAYAIPVIDYNAPYFSRILIGSENFAKPSEFVVGGRQDLPGRTGLQNAYVHELGNIISILVTGDAYAYGDELSGHPDSGLEFQICVFGQ